MGRKRKLFDVEFQDEQYQVRCRQCRNLAKVSYTRGPKVRIACDCGMSTELELSSWSKYVRNIKLPPPKPESSVQMVKGEGFASLTKKGPEKQDGDSEYVRVDGMTVHRDAYGGQGIISPGNSYARRDEDDENSSGVGYVADLVQKKWSCRARSGKLLPKRGPR